MATECILEPATLPGLSGQWIRGADVLPLHDHANFDGDIQLLSPSGAVWGSAWNTVNAGDIWRPYPPKDPRPLFTTIA